MCTFNLNLMYTVVKKNWTNITFSGTSNKCNPITIIFSSNNCHKTLLYCIYSFAKMTKMRKVTAITVATIVYTRTL